MRIFRQFCCTLVGVIVFLGVSAQESSSLRINELFINNVDNYIDEYGNHSPWVEIFNTSYNVVNIAECYLTDDTTGVAEGKINPNWYKIPKGDPRTAIAQRGYLVFYLDNAPTYGTFHTNFTPLDSNSNNYIALIAANGRSVIDMVVFPASLRQNTQHPYGYRVNYTAEDLVEVGGKMVSNLDFLDHFTPGSSNDYEIKATKAEFIQEKDPYGIGLAIISMAVVFSALFLIFLMLKGFNFFAARSSAAAAGGHGAAAPVATEEKKAAPVNANEETIAALAAALHFHFGAQHDEESGVLTFAEGDNSPWSHKHLPIKKVVRK